MFISITHYNIPRIALRSGTLLFFSSTIYRQTRLYGRRECVCLCKRCAACRPPHSRRDAHACLAHKVTHTHTHAYGSRGWIKIIHSHTDQPTLYHHSWSRSSSWSLYGKNHHDSFTHIFGQMQTKTRYLDAGMILGLENQIYAKVRENDFWMFVCGYTLTRYIVRRRHTFVEVYIPKRWHAEQSVSVAFHMQHVFHLGICLYAQDDVALATHMAGRFS